jgi:hypothetical protein
MRNRNMMKSSGWALALAAGYCLSLGTPARACNGPQKAMANLPDAVRLNMALARLGSPPHDPAAQTSPHDIVPPAPPNIVGLWDTKFFSQGQVVDEIYDLWNADGTEIEVDASNPIEGNVCNGVWIQTGTLIWKLTHPSWAFDVNGNLIGTLMIREVIFMDPKGNQYTGTVTYDFFDLNGTPIDHEDGTLSAVRIQPS